VAALAWQAMGLEEDDEFDSEIDAAQWQKQHDRRDFLAV
jgi:hypothetical protein